MNKILITLLFAGTLFAGMAEASPEKAMSVQVRIQADHIEITDADIASRFRLRAPPTVDELRALPATAYIVHSSLSVITKSGASAESKGVVEHTIDGEKHDIGAILTCTPVVGPDGYTIDLIKSWRSVRLVKAEYTDLPLIAHSTIMQSMAIRHGGTLVLPVRYEITARPDGELQSSPNPHFLIVSATLIDPDGKPIADR